MPSVKEQKTKGILNLNRSTLHLIIQFITGHCTLKRHLSILQIVGDPGCRFCEAGEETPIHMVNECEAAWRERRTAYEENLDRSWLWKLVKFVTSPRIKGMFLEQEIYN